MVTVMPVRVCGQCRPCRTGNEHLCEKRQVPGTSAWHGTFAERFVAPGDKVFRLPPLPVEVAAQIEPLAVAVHAANRVGSLGGKRVNVIGAGAIGHLVAVVAFHHGASNVCCIDTDPLAIELAEANGFTTVQPTAAEYIEPADITFLTANYDGSVDDAIGATLSSGVVVILSMYEGRIPVDIYASVYNEIDIRGSMLYRKVDFINAIEIAEKHSGVVSGVAGAVVNFAGAPEVFRNLAGGNKTALKTLVLPGGALDM